MKAICEQGKLESDEIKNDDSEEEAIIQDNYETTKGIDISSMLRHLEMFSSHLPDLEKVKTFISSIDTGIIILFFALVIIIQWYTSRNTGGVISIDHANVAITKSELLAITRRLDDVVAEVQETRETLREILAVLKEKQI